MLGDVLHLDRVAQVGLVAAVFLQGFRKRNPPPAFCHRLALGKLLEHARDRPAPSPRTRPPARQSSFQRRADKTRPAGGRRAGPRRESTARSGSSGRSPTSSAAACTAAAPAAARRIFRDESATAPGSRARLPARTPSGSGSGTRRSPAPSSACASKSTMAPRVMMFWCSFSRRRSRKRYLSLMSSGYSCSPNTGSGSSAAGPSTSISLT